MNLSELLKKRSVVLHEQTVEVNRLNKVVEDIKEWLINDICIFEEMITKSNIENLLINNGMVPLKEMTLKIICEDINQSKTIIPCTYSDARLITEVRRMHFNGINIVLSNSRSSIIQPTRDLSDRYLKYVTVKYDLVPNTRGTFWYLRNELPKTPKH